MKLKTTIIGILSITSLLLSACGDSAAEAERKAQQERENTAKSLKPVDKSVFNRVPAPSK